MLKPSRPALSSCLGVLGVLVAVAVFGARSSFADVVIVAPTEGEVLTAGRMVELRWKGLPPDVDEMELLLLVVEDAPVHVRLTPQLAGSRRSYLWRVPNLPSQRARLRLRWGRDGVETESEAGASFTIRADTRHPVVAIRRCQGEYWIGSPELDHQPLCGAEKQVDASDSTSALVAGVESSTESGPEPDSFHFVERSRDSHHTVCSALTHPEISAHGPLTIPLRP